MRGPVFFDAVSATASTIPVSRNHRANRHARSRQRDRAFHPGYKFT